MNKMLVVLALVGMLDLAGAAMAQPVSLPSAAASDPLALGWMQGFPPPADRLIRGTDADAFSFPKLRWSACHVRQLMPTVAVGRGDEAVRELPLALDAALGGLRFIPQGGGAPMSLDEAFDATYGDGLLVLHHGRIVYERYAGCLGRDGLHATMSITKSLTGLLGEMLIVEGVLDEGALVGDLIPELRNSGFGDASVRQVLDMSTALDFSEDYSNPKADIWAYARAGSALPAAGGKAPIGYLAYLQGVKKKGEHGEAFAYRTVNSDVLGWLIARSTGKPVNEVLAERIWSRLGAEREAFYTVDSLGTPYAGGGFNATLRDLGRLGQLLLDGGQLDGRQLIPPEAVARLTLGGDRGQFARAGLQLPGWSYAAMWWHTHDAHRAYTARGVHGQTIWIDPQADMVIVRLASHPQAANAANDAISLAVWRAVADHLLAHDPAPLLGREWVVEDIAGGGVIDNSRTSLHFSADGRLSGSASCNRFIGRYEARDGTLHIDGQLGSTMMMCPEALMNQERRLLDLLPRLDRYRIDDTGALVLGTPDGDAVKARR
ncbi:MAG: serine hydrolase [Gammaproteobacteria bacterium]|nr:serine hydrolase [Gammaproteobacteria bacterium]